MPGDGPSRRRRGAVRVFVLRQGYRLAWAAITVGSLLLRPHTSGVKCLLTSGDDVLLVRHTYGRRTWEVPGGFMRRGEDPADAARREMLEELGLDLAGLRPAGVLEVRLAGRRSTLHCFSADIGDRGVDPDPVEIAAVEMVPRARLAARLPRYARPLLEMLSA